MADSNEKIYKGINGKLILTETGIIIRRGFWDLTSSKQRRGDKSTPYPSITAVQLNKAGLMSYAYIQFTVPGSIDDAKKVKDDENAIQIANNFKEFEEAKAIIEQRMLEARNNSTKPSSNLDELEKLAELKDKGIITEEEFNAKKRQILGI